MIKKISLIKDNNIILDLINMFLDSYWYAPQDVLLRTVEALIWAKRFFNPPVLDIGVGNASNSKFIFLMNQKIDVGIDIDPDGIQQAKNSENYNKVLVADAVKMPFKSKSFNTILSNSTFEHINNDISAVNEVSRLLKPNGLFYLTVPAPNLINFLSEIGLNRQEIVNYNKRVNHIHIRTFIDWNKILTNRNMKVVYHKYYFPKKVVKQWFKLYKIATFKPYNRELWSYLQDKRSSNFIPKFIIKKVLTRIIFSNVSKSFKGVGGMQFIIAQKTK